MKISKEEKLFEILGELDDDILAEALFIDNGKKLKKAGFKSKIIILRPVLIRAAIFIVCMAIVIFAIVIQNENKHDIIVSLDNSSSSSKQDLSSEFKNSSIPQQSGGDESSSKTEQSDSSSVTENPSFATSSHTSSQSPQTKPPVSSETESSPEEDYSGYYINSIDKLNFYAVKKIIEETKGAYTANGSTTVLKGGGFSMSAPLTVSKKVYCHINADTVFTITKATYFTAVLEDENGFLAQKLGGTGIIEVVVTENSLNDMITFKKGENFYSCLMDGKNVQDFGDMKTEVRFFTTHKYIDGMEIVKNYDQKNFQFVVYYDHYEFGSNVTGFECHYFNGIEPDVLTVPVPDAAYLQMDNWTIMDINQSFTVNQLESHFGKN